MENKDSPPDRSLHPKRHPARRLLRQARTATQSLRIAQTQVHLEALGLAGNRQQDTPRRALRPVSLLDARQKAYEHRKIARAGGDPIAIKGKPGVPTETWSGRFRGNAHDEGRRH